jgi:hypothetical protein
MAKLKNRLTFSKYIYDLHEKVNKLLHKKSGLSYNVVRKRYEHFRARCTKTEYNKKIFKFRKSRKNKKDGQYGKKDGQYGKNQKNKTRKEKGCNEPLYGKKSKCIIKIVPANEKCATFQMDKSCMRSNKK